MFSTHEFVGFFLVDFRPLLTTKVGENCNLKSWASLFSVVWSCQKGTTSLFCGHAFRDSVNSFFGHVNENDTILFNCQRTSWVFYTWVWVTAYSPVKHQSVSGCVSRVHFQDANQLWMVVKAASRSSDQDPGEIFVREIPLISGKSRWVNYSNLARKIEDINF